MSGKAYQIVGESYAPDYQSLGDGSPDPDTAALDGPVLLNGGMFFPATNTQIMTMGKTGDGFTRITILAFCGKNGIAIPLSPPHARAFAAALISCADEVEQTARTAADAALRKASGK
jgi:hypothetical protein